MARGRQGGGGKEGGREGQEEEGSGKAWRGARAYD
jgi:hypothetical protein